MSRVVFYAILLILFSRAIIRLWNGIVDGLGGQPRGGQAQGGPIQPQRGVQMARDPVCGTFVIPGRAVTLSVGRDQIHFCSASCRDKYRARTA